MVSALAGDGLPEEKEKRRYPRDGIYEHVIMLEEKFFYCPNPPTHSVTHPLRLIFDGLFADDVHSINLFTYFQHFTSRGGFNSRPLDIYIYTF